MSRLFLPWFFQPWFFQPWLEKGTHEHVQKDSQRQTSTHSKTKTQLQISSQKKLCKLMLTESKFKRISFFHVMPYYFSRNHRIPLITDGVQSWWGIREWRGRAWTRARLFMPSPVSLQIRLVGVTVFLKLCAQSLQSVWVQSWVGCFWVFCRAWRVVVACRLRLLMWGKEWVN